MKVLNPSENLDSIISLIESAKKFLVIVSPYNDLNGWDNLKDAINKASSKKIDIRYYVREGEGRKGLGELNAKVFEVQMLHAKMFFTESKAMISSGNLTNRPDINWVIDLDKPDEYKKITGFFEEYIKPLAKPLGN